MFETIWSWITSNLILVCGLPIAGLGLKYILGKYLDKEAEEWFGGGVEKVFFAAFSFITTALNKVTAGLWNKIVEPYFKVFLTILVSRALKGTMDGLDSDNSQSQYGRFNSK